jgi:hypothetical protein
VNLRPGLNAVEVVQTEERQGSNRGDHVVDKPARNVRAYDREGKLPPRVLSGDNGQRGKAGAERRL